jgi:hypothetical protein
MPRNEFDGGLNDLDARVVADAEADLERLLAVEPSSEFTAKVRARIEAERARPATWLSGWRLGFAVASLAVVVLAIAFLLRTKPAAIPSSAPTVVQKASTPEPATVPAQREAVREEPKVILEKRAASREARAARREPRVARSEDRVARSEPEVLVPPNQRIALDRALALANGRALDGRMFEAPVTVKPAVAGESAVRALVVDDVIVPPLTPSSGGIEK